MEVCWFFGKGRPIPSLEPEERPRHPPVHGSRSPRKRQRILTMLIDNSNLHWRHIWPVFSLFASEYVPTGVSQILRYHMCLKGMPPYHDCQQQLASRSLLPGISRHTSLVPKLSHLLFICVFCHNSAFVLSVSLLTTIVLVPAGNDVLSIYLGALSGLCIGCSCPAEIRLAGCLCSCSNFTLPIVSYHPGNPDCQQSHVHV